ncbi:MAG: hypothetical protein Q8O00_00660 [Holophaga sp.]|nr:hypothetical protein [Holophaga sp.]
MEPFGLLILTFRTQTKERQLVAGHTKAGRLPKRGEARFHRAGLDFYGAATAFTLKVVVVASRVAPHKTHDLIDPYQGFGPPLIDETLQVSIDGRYAGFISALLSNFFDR